MAKAGRPRERVMLTAEEAAELSRTAAAPSTAQARALRARIVLLAGEDVPTLDIAERLGVSAATVAKWRRRFIAGRLDGLADAPRSGAPVSSPLGQGPDAVRW